MVTTVKWCLSDFCAEATKNIGGADAFIGPVTACLRVPTPVKSGRRRSRESPPLHR